MFSTTFLKQQANLIAAIKQNNLDLLTFLDLCAIRDENGNTLFHYAAYYGYHVVFNTLLKNQKDFVQQLKNKQGVTPWHIAAKMGYSEFFVDLDEKSIFNLIDINSLDDEGNTLLHLASIYDDKMLSARIKAKKKIIALLIEHKININQKNHKHKTALHLAAQFGCYETVKILLRFPELDSKITDDEDASAQLTSYAIAVKFKHKRIANLIDFYQNNKMPKAKSDKIPENTLHPIVYLAQDVDAKEEFIKKLKLLTTLTQRLDGQEINVIDLRIQTAEKKYRYKNLLMAFWSALCPAGTVAAFIGGFVTLGAIPILATIITLILLPLIYIPCMYACYKIRTHEYSKMMSESLFQQWQTGRIQAYISKLNQLEKRKINTQKDFENLKKDFALLNAEAKDFLSVRKNNKIKIPLQYMTREEYKALKAVGQTDAKQNNRWTNKLDKLKAFIVYHADICCPLGTGMSIGASIATLIAGKISWGFLGVSMAGFLGGPIGLAIVTLVMTALFAAFIAGMIYKASYKRELKEMGRVKRDVLMACDATQRNLDLAVTLQEKVAQKIKAPASHSQEELMLEPPSRAKKSLTNEKVVALSVFKPANELGNQQKLPLSVRKYRTF